MARVRGAGDIPEQGRLFKSKKYDLVGDYKKEIMVNPGNFAAAEALAKLYVKTGRESELKEFIATVATARRIRPSAHLTCKLAILYQHQPGQDVSNYKDAWIWYTAVVALYREQGPAILKKACGEAWFRLAKMIQENKGIKFADYSHLAKDWYEKALECGIAKAAGELKQLDGAVELKAETKDEKCAASSRRFTKG